MAYAQHEPFEVLASSSVNETIAIEKAHELAYEKCVRNHSFGVIVVKQCEVHEVYEDCKLWCNPQLTYEATCTFKCDDRFDW
jgi:hypothetical protein